MIQQTSPLTAVFSEVLANMAFLFTEPPADPPLEEVGRLECSIAYRGPTRGRLSLRCTPQFALTLAANLLDIDPESPEAALQGQDALKELLNVLCGQLVTTLYGQEDAFELTIPVITRPTEALAANGGELLETTVEGEPVQLAHFREG
jgi:CheY-specific phosphatase CheX